ncbi:MAG: serine/threonine protein kinase [Planctomycetes bacterium]|nr:serine/threonine protein kinase [Planctomycetota bacterium]
MSRDEHREISRQLQSAVREGKPVSYARLLLQGGVATKTVEETLRRGHRLEAVRCDACGATIPQELLRKRREYPCGECGSLVLGFRAYAKAKPESHDGDSDEYPQRMAPAGERVLKDALPPVPESKTQTLAFGTVLALPERERMEKLNEAETMLVFGDLAESYEGVGQGSGEDTPQARRERRKRAEEERRRVGEYRVKRKIGRGSTGNVYLAKHQETGEKVALKVLRKQLARDPEYLERFHREVVEAPKERHPNVVGVVGGGYDKGKNLHHLALEYVSGGTLADFLEAQGGTLSEPEVLPIVLGIAKGLSFIARHGLVHRDIKPANVMLTDDLQPKLTDLGIARHLARTTRVTQTGVVLGTPAYLAPEQALGVEDIDIRADLFALGVCMWEMLTGRLPLDEGVTTAELIVRHVDEDIPDVRIYAPTVTPEAAQVVNGLCARLREDRYGHPDSVVADVERLMRGESPLGASGSNAVAPPQAPREPKPKKKSTDASARRESNPAPLEVGEAAGGSKALVVVSIVLILITIATVGAALYLKFFRQ